jgi:predicted outer membrane repeat protein
LFAGATYFVTQPIANGANGLTGLPPISTDLEIIGVRLPEGTQGTSTPVIARGGNAPLRFFLVTEEGSLHLNNLTIEGGQAFSDNCRGGPDRGRGGAVFVQERINRNPPRLSPPNTRGDITLEGVIFNVNSASCDGGAVYLAGAENIRQLRVTNSVFVGNRVLEAGELIGGGLFGNGGAIARAGSPQPVDPDEFVVSDSFFTDNVAAGRGGAVHAPNGYFGDLLTFDGIEPQSTNFPPFEPPHLLIVCPSPGPLVPGPSDPPQALGVNCSSFVYHAPVANQGAIGRAFCLERRNDQGRLVPGVGPGRRDDYRGSFYRDGSPRQACLTANPPENCGCF